MPDAAAGKVTTVGRRKEAVARVRLSQGEGRFTVNGREADQYFQAERDRNSIKAPLLLARDGLKYDVSATVRGGGATGQAGALVQGVARALAKSDPDVMPKLRAQGFLTRDSRMVERKKYGRPKARKRFQYSKR